MCPVGAFEGNGSVNKDQGRGGGGDGRRRKGPRGGGQIVEM